MSIILYSNNCPKCKVLKSKLNDKSISYKEENDMDEILKTGFRALPLLKVNGEILQFKEANDWINQR